MALSRALFLCQKGWWKHLKSGIIEVWDRAVHLTSKFPSLLPTLKWLGKRIKPLGGCFVLDEMKRCTTCEEEFLATSEYFGVRQRNKDGLDGRCRKCNAKLRVDYNSKIKAQPKVLPSSGVKICSICKKGLPADEFHFYRKSSNRDGLHYACRECEGGKFSQSKLIAKQGYKICYKCNEELPSTDEYFAEDNRNKDGIKGQCRKCLLGYTRLYQKEHPEATRRYSKKYSDTHKVVLAERGKQWRDRNIEYRVEYHKQYRDENRELLNERSRLQYKKNGERYRLYRKENREPLAERGRLYYKENRAARAEHNRQYAKLNPEKRRVICQRYKAKKKKLPHTFTVNQWQKAKLHFDNKCAFCGEEVPLTMEHFVAVTKDGEFTKENIFPTCQSCNSSKYTHDCLVWFRKQPTYTQAKENKIMKYLGYKNYKQQLSIF